MHHSWQGANVEKILFFCLAFVKSIGPTLFCLFSWTVLKSASTAPLAGCVKIAEQVLSLASEQC